VGYSEEEIEDALGYLPEIRKDALEIMKHVEKAPAIKLAIKISKES